MAQGAELYKAAIDADRRWRAELEKQFGDDACNVRYTSRGRGEPGSTLRRLHDAFASTSATWFKWYREQRQSA